MKASVLLALLFLAACDASKPYPDLPDKNLRIQTSSAGAKVRMQVYRLDQSCADEYAGTVALDQPVVHVGLPAGQRSKLIFEFLSSGLLARTSIKKQVQLAPQPGLQYDARISYKDDLYSLSLREIDPRTGNAREMDLFAGC